MKHLCTLICVLALGIASALAQGKMVYSTASDGYLNIREEPQSDSYIMDILYTGGAGAKYLGKKGNWYHVEYDGQQGYVSASHAVCSTQPPRVKPLKRKLYYIVVASFDNLENAKAAAEDMPDSLLSPVYRHTDKDGNVKYRICTSCHLDKHKAEAEQKQIKELFLRDSWIWTTQGFADCVYRPGSLYDGAISIAPLTPRQ